MRPSNLLGVVTLPKQSMLYDMSMKTVGIDALTFSTPRAYLDLTDLAAARNIPSEKYTKGLGALRMAIADRNEDPVTMATDAAARMFVHADIDVANIGFCAVGTETGIDHSKPIASYVHGLLGLPQKCRVYDAKHACFGGTAALMAACEWIASGAARGRTALVICSDIARYELGSPGEPTQGAGAVAMLVSESPRLLAIDVGQTGSFSWDVHDFWRPLHRRDALVDGKFSVSCYLDALAGAFNDWREQSLSVEPLVRSAYHVPYVKMAKKADARRAAIEGLDEAAAEARFAREVGSSLIFSGEVGNIYTGSLYMAIASMLHHEGTAIEGGKIGLFSYGSGCVAQFFTARVCDGAGDLAARLRLDAPLSERVRLSFDEYQAIRRADAAEGALFKCSESGEIRVPSDRTAFLGIDEEERRIYRRATRPNSAVAIPAAADLESTTTSSRWVAA